MLVLITLRAKICDISLESIAFFVHIIKLKFMKIVVISLQKVKIGALMLCMK